jgi:HEAT repeat protein
MVPASERRTWALGLLMGAVVACSPSPAMRAAERGDRVTLREVLERREKSGRVSNDEAASLATTVAARDLRAALGPDAVLRVREVRPCARELDDVLAERARVHDAAGAQAALARIESGRMDLGDARATLGDADPGWRAVAARALVRPEDRHARAKALLDPEPGVRRQAARAARDAADPSDLEALAETARVDPEPIVRTEAVRAIAVLPPLSVYREALRLVIASEQGEGVIEASTAVLARRDAGSDLVNLAVSQLVRSIAVGSHRIRRQALAEAPLDNPELHAAVKAASNDEDVDVRIAALARLADHEAGVTERLEELARPGQRFSAHARQALAVAGDRRVQSWIERDLAAPAPEDRLSAVAALSALGVAARGAPLLAEEDPSLRVRAACAILMGARIAR